MTKLARARNVTMGMLLVGPCACGRAGAGTESPDTVGPVAVAPAVEVGPAASSSSIEPYTPPDDPRLFTVNDVFDLEWAADPRISPDGRYVVYVRGSMDVMLDRRRGQLWLASVDGKAHEPLTSLDDGDFRAPRWSPDGDRIAFVGAERSGSQLHVRWMKTGQTARITNLIAAPSEVEWSPDGTMLAFTMRVKDSPPPLAKLPEPPEGAKWADPPTVIDKMTYREDGDGYVRPGFDHLFVVPADGGSPQQLSTETYHHEDPAWTRDGSILVVANRRPDWEHDPRESEIYEVVLATGEIKALTDRDGPDESPVVSPDGKRIAYVGYDDKLRGHHVTRLHVMNRDGSGSRVLTAGLDRSVRGPVWSADGKGVYVRYDDRGNTKAAYVSLSGSRRVIASDVGGLSLGRPYSAGSFTVARNGTVAYTTTRPEHPADLAVMIRGAGKPRRLTRLNRDVLDHKRLGEVEEIWVKSSHDQADIQAWIVKPPGFDAKKKYPLILEIHGGPFANYGDRFAAELQIYASEGYVVVYANPRGSTSYGDDFANLIHHAYPGNDYDDLMTVVDEVVSRGYVDDKRLYVTGGSGGGVLSSWIIGKTNRFRAAVVAKPVINWYSFVLTADHSSFFARYWFPGMPWDNPEEYLRRSPLSLVGNVKTPTMLLTGESDYRTPMSESEQYYQPLKLRKVDTVLVRIPGASHSIAKRPSQLIAKVSYVLAWFQRYSS
jgi:acylaminoacyl-peptidase